MYEKGCEKMNNRRKRFTAWLLTFCMIVTVLAVHGGTLDVSASTDLEDSTESKEIIYEWVSDISSYRSGTYTPYTKNGYVFAGWYKSEDETQPLAKEAKDGGAYAKLVPEKVWNVQAQISATLCDSDTGNDENGAIRFVTTVDSDKYQNVGFEFSIDHGAAFEKTITTVYSSLYAVSNKDGSGTAVSEQTPSKVGCDVSKFFVAYGFRNVPQADYGMSIAARPFWLTLDGTKVYGKQATRNVNQGIFGTTWTDPWNMSCYTEEGAPDTYTALKDQASYLYSKATVGNVGVAATVTALSGQNAEGNAVHPSAGVTVKVGDRSVQFLRQSDNNLFKRVRNHTWTAEMEKWGTENPWYAEGVCQIKAFVKDGHFYLLVNNVQIYCMNMVALFEDYDENTPVSIGICGWDASLGTVKFTDLQYLSGEEVASSEAKEWGYYSDAPNADSYSFADGSFALTNQWSSKSMPLQGQSKTWQIEGTMERTNDAEIGMGFGIKAGDKFLKLLGYVNTAGNGIMAAGAENEGWLNEWIPETRRKYVLNGKADGFFAQPRTRDTAAFRAVIYEDVLYVWFDGELCWRVPLTDNDFCKFEAGSDYELSLWIQGNWGGLGKMTGLQVKMGYQVTGQTAFATDKADKVHSFADTMAIFRKTLGAENGDMILEDPFTGTYLMSDKGSVWLYGEEEKGECGLTVDIAWLSKSGWWDSGAFISVRIGEEERLFMGWSNPSNFNNGLFCLTAPTLWVNKFAPNGNFWEYEGRTLGDGTSGIIPYKEDGTTHVDAYVKDGYFRIAYNGNVLVNKRMAELFPEGYGNYAAADSPVSIGIGGLQTNQNQARFSNVTFLTAEETAALVLE